MAKYNLTEGRRGALVGAILLFVVVTLAFAPFAYGDRTLASNASETASLFTTGASMDPKVRLVAFRGVDPAAAGWQTEPTFHLEHQEVFGEHVFPLWNPYVGYGEPLAANLLSQPFFPLSWPLVADPSPRAYNWFIILRFYFGALLTFLYLRFFVRFSAALAGGIGFAFTGYLILFFNIAHLSVEALIPGLFLTVEYLVRKPSARSTVALACMIAVIIFGGMPESALLAFALAYPYAVVRILTDEPMRRRWKPLFARLIAATALGLGISACLLLPANEFLKRSLNQHDPALVSGMITGFAADNFSFPILATYLAPLIYGPPWANIFTGFSGWSGIRGFFGVAQTFFALIAIVGIVTEARRRIPSAWSPGAYFLAGAAFFFLKRFGSPLVNWVGGLPGFQPLNFIKYQEVELGFCVACLAALGVEQLAAGKVKAVTIWIAALVPLALLSATAEVEKPLLLALTTNHRYFFGALGLALFVLTFVSVASWFALTVNGRRWLPQIAFVGAIVIASEGVASYIAPLWYVVNGEAPLSLDAANGAPYVEFLRSRTAVDRSRFYGEDFLLAPEWSSAFGIGDVQDLDALYDRRYMTFIQAFLPTGPASEAIDRFQGVKQLDFDQVVEQRFLALSSVAYVGTQRTLGGDHSLLRIALAARPNDIGPPLRMGTWTIAGSRRDAVFMHAPRFRYPVPVTVPKTASVLHYGIAMDPQVWTNPAEMCGDGVNYSIELQDDRGKIAPLAHEYIDPKHDAGERRWLDFSAPVARWAGREVQLLFSTAPGPSGGNCADWALWSNIGFDVNPPTVKTPFHLVYDTVEANIYHYDGALPRVALYTSAATAPDDIGALHLLSDPAFNPYARVVITQDGEPARDAVAKLGTRPGSVTAGHIDVYASQHVHAWVDASAPSLAVLNDIAFPGWVAQVDGHDSPVITANYMFRGVLVQPGHHSLDFWYRPRSFRIGLAITLISIVIATFYLGRNLIIRRKRQANERSK